MMIKSPLGDLGARHSRSCLRLKEIWHPNGIWEDIYLMIRYGRLNCFNQFQCNGAATIQWLVPLGYECARPFTKTKR